ncbi:MAG: hypothetical protein K2N87_08375 [Eubacterium sp.]|nr:hypothetical protein [Eubacterium sp.]
MRKKKVKKKMEKTQAASSRQKAAKALVAFLFGMLFFTLLSRGIYAYRMPRIAVGQASPRSISHTISVEGAVEEAKREAETGLAQSDSQSSGSWIFRAPLTREQADLVKDGDTVSLRFRDGKVTEDGCSILQVRETENGEFEAVVAPFESKSRLSRGETGVMEFMAESGWYECCVPLSAVYSDLEKNYVLLIRETETIFGTELSAVRRDVAVIDQNESFAALKDGTLSAQDTFIVYANKTAQPGDKVRLLEDED